MPIITKIVWHINEMVIIQTTQITSSVIITHRIKVSNPGMKNDETKKLKSETKSTINIS